MYGSTYGTFQYASIPDAGFSIALTESVTFTDLFTKVTSRLLTESATYTDTIVRLTARLLLESVTFTDVIINRVVFLARRVGIIKGVKKDTGTQTGTGITTQ